MLLGDNSTGIRYANWRDSPEQKRKEESSRPHMVILTEEARTKSHFSCHKDSTFNAALRDPSSLADKSNVSP
jgi:hypothetical protein